MSLRSLQLNTQPGADEAMTPTGRCPRDLGRLHRGAAGFPSLTLSFPKRLCLPGCSDLHLLDMLTPTERKRQGYIHELIVTEENYVNDLQLVTEVPAALESWGELGVALHWGAGKEVEALLRRFES